MGTLSKKKFDKIFTFAVLIFFCILSVNVNVYSDHPDIAPCSDDPPSGDTGRVVVKILSVKPNSDLEGCDDTSFL